MNSSRVIPTSFEPGDLTVTAFPLPRDWVWTSLERALRAAQPTVVMPCIPAFWQLEPLLHGACRKAGAPIFMNQLSNIPLGIAAIRDMGADVIIAEAAYAATFAEQIIKKNLSLPKTWVLLYRAESGSWDIPAVLTGHDIVVSREVHLFPGLPILTGCPARPFGPLLHPSDTFVWEFGEHRTLLTGTGKKPLPLQQYELPRMMREGPACDDCGGRTTTL